MAMQLKNLPPFFQRMIEDILFPAHLDLRAFVSVYIPHIIIVIERGGLTKEELMALQQKQLNQ